MTEHNLFQEIEADLEHQRYAELWKKYGVFIVVAAIALIVGTGAVSYWRTWHAARNQEASVALFKLMDESAGDNPDLAKQVGDLDQYSKTGPTETHRTLARLDAAGLAAKIGDLPKAAQLYDEVAKDSAVETTFRQFADLMSVRAQLDTSDPVQLQKRLEPMLTGDSPWHYPAREYEGFLALRAGQTEKARQVFTELSQDARVPQGLSARATDMMHFLSE